MYIVGGWVASADFPAEEGGLCVLALDHCGLCQVSVGLVLAVFVSLAEYPLGGVGLCFGASSNQVCIATPLW